MKLSKTWLWKLRLEWVVFSLTLIPLAGWVFPPMLKALLKPHAPVRAPALRPPDPRLTTPVNQEASGRRRLSWFGSAVPRILGGRANF